MDQYLTRIVHAGGRPPKAPATAEALWEAFVEYVESATGTPIRLNQVNRAGVAYMAERPLSRQGFMAFLGLGYDWAHFVRYYSEREGYGVVLGKISNIIEAQQLEGAVVGNYNANIVARLNGYREGLDHTSDGEKLDLVINLK